MVTDQFIEDLLQSDRKYLWWYATTALVILVVAGAVLIIPNIMSDAGSETNWISVTAGLVLSGINLLPLNAMRALIERRSRLSRYTKTRQRLLADENPRKEDVGEIENLIWEEYKIRNMP